ncbi:hypothetical protein [Streptacidiphilus cavernicola]|uniref:RanBP2-type domain-containing protein n=1 Tax=Streptacidiphilus cavernicola TaxID=3342716 RepID=A0ABV6VPB6_9ACTN
MTDPRPGADAPEIHTRVCIDDLGPFDAKVDPTDRWNGWLCPYFTLDTVRVLAARTQELAAQDDNDTFDTVHVIDGGTDDNGKPRAIVVHISWQHFTDDPEHAAGFVAPNSEGLYGIGAAEWTWSFAVWWCPCGEPANWHQIFCGHCGTNRPDQCR